MGRCSVNISSVNSEVSNVTDVEPLIDLVVLLLMTGFVFPWLDVPNDGIMTGEPDVKIFDSVSLEGNEDTTFVVLYVALPKGVDEVEIEGFLSVVAFTLTELLFSISIVFVGKTPEISVLFFSLLVISFWRWCPLIKLAVPVLEALIWVLV